MGRKVYLLIALALFVLLLPASTQAHEFNMTDGNGFLLFPETALSEPLNPKIDCHPSGYHCLALVYENNSFYGRGIKVWYTTNFFKTFWNNYQIASISKDYSTLGSYYINYGLPYDVKYVNGKYYFFIENTVYTYDGATLTTLDTFDGNTKGNRWGLGFDDIYNGILTYEVYTPTGVFSAMRGAGLSSGRYTVKASWSGSSYLRECLNNYDASNLVSCSNNISALGSTATVTSLPSFPTAYTGIDYWDGNNIYYQRYDNSSWRVETTDLLTYQTPSLIYAWDQGAINETINHTDSSTTDSNRIYIYERQSTNAGDSGIWVYNLPTTRVVIFGEGYDITTKTTEIVNITTSINCSASGYYQSDSGQYSDLSTPCQYNNRVVLNSFTYQPVSYTFTNYTIPTSCLYKTNYIRTTASKGYYKPYNFTLTFRDAFFGNVISGVTSILNGNTETSNANGEAIYNTLPIESPNFTAESFDEVSCTQQLSFTGSPSNYVLLASKSGYETYTDSFQISKSPFIVETDFTTSKTILLEPENTRVEVFVYSLDGIELSPSRTTTTIYGSNDTYWVYGNQWFHQNHSTSIPALFYLLNNTGTYNVNISMIYFNEYNKSINVTTGSYNRVEFYINYSSWELPCYTSSDCQPDMCAGKFLKKLTGCFSNVCTYQTLDCGSPAYCDVNIGCVDLVSLTNCTKDQDCVNYCNDNYTMVDYKCGSDGYCKGNYIDCETNCNASLGYCQELAGCLDPAKTTFKVGYMRKDGRFMGTTFEAYCDFGTANTYNCQGNGIEIKKGDLDYWGLTWDNIVATPKGWIASFTDDGNTLTFNSVSLYCDNYCNLTYTFCDKGCDIESGVCLGTAGIIDDSYGLATGGHDFFTGIVLFYNSVFQDIHTRSFMWFIWGIIIYVGVWFLKVKALPKTLSQVSLGDHHTGELGLLLIWFLIGSVFGQFYWFVWFSVVVIVVYIFAKYWTSRQGGS
jgi:hypothetical protein